MNYIRALQAGRLWATRHPDATPNDYQERAKRYEKTRGKPYADAWFEGLLCEYWTPTMDEYGRKLTSTKDI
jgi:hypothetical protein